jgi:galactokinase
VSALTDDRLRRRARHVVSEIQRVSDTVAAIGAGDWDTVGSLFGDSHRSLRDDYAVSCAELDAAVETAVAAGAVGARMTGGGFGGSAVAIVPEDRLATVGEAVLTEFAARGFRSPLLLRVLPSGPARPC